MLGNKATMPGFWQRHAAEGGAHGGAIQEIEGQHVHLHRSNAAALLAKLLWVSRTS